MNEEIPVQVLKFLKDAEGWYDLESIFLEPVGDRLNLVFREGSEKGTSFSLLLNNNNNLCYCTNSFWLIRCNQKLETTSRNVSFGNGSGKPA